MPKRFSIVQNSLKTTYLFRYSYLKKLVEFGYVSVVAPNDDEHAKNKLIELGVHVYPIPYSEKISGRLWSYWLMNLFVLKERLLGAVLVCHFIITLLICFPSLIPFNNKLIISVEGLGSIFSKPSQIRKIFAFFLRRSKAKVIFCNQDERKAIGKSKDIVTGGIGVDLNKFPIKESINTVDGYYRLLYVGRLIKDKGVFDAIEVFRRLRSQGLPVVLDLVGDLYPNNPSALSVTEVQQLQSEFGSSINFAGFNQDVARWYQQDHILLLPSVREGFPVCVMEASSIGIPVVGYAVPGMIDAVIIGVNGLLAKFGDLDELTALTKSLLCYECLDQYRISSPKLAHENYSREKKSQEMMEFILKLTS